MRVHKLFTILAKIFIVFPLFLLVSGNAFALDTSEDDYKLKLLGKYVFFDKISNPARMSCATCHSPTTGGTGNVSGINLHQVVVTGANPHAAGNLKPPTNSYASFIPKFTNCRAGGVRPEGQRYCGGNFWNGRAEGRESALLGGATKHIGNEIFQGIDSGANPQVPGYAKYIGGTSDQALNPMPNTAEQNIDRQSVCRHVKAASYGALYKIAWGVDIDCSNAAASESAPDVSSEAQFDISFKRIMLAVGAWQHSKELNSFSSKRDAALAAEQACLDGTADADPTVCNHPNFLNSMGKFPLVGFTDQENLGHDLFYNTAFPRGTPPFTDLPVTNCSFCHLSDRANRDGTGKQERYTDDAYHNIGTPVNPELPADPDPGISGHAQLPPPIDAGGYKAPSLRNVDKRKGKGFIKAYAHNGWFKSLESIVHFYNTSQVKKRCKGAVTEKVALAKNCWPEAEWPDTVSTSRLVGKIGMTPEQEAALVSYMKTFTDKETPKAPLPYLNK